MEIRFGATPRKERAGRGNRDGRTGARWVGIRTEDEFLGWREHVERECDFVLVAFALEPAEEGGCVKHCG